MKNNCVLVIISILFILTISCSLIYPAATLAPTPSLDLPKTETARANQTLSAQSTISAQATQQAAHETTTAVIMQATQKAFDTVSTSTAQAAGKLTSTAEVVQQATAQAQGMLDKIKAVGFKGGSGASSGKYYRLEDYEASLAKINYISAPYDSGYSPENFAIRADISWDSASDVANWDRSACGFIFGLHEQDYYDLILLTLQGYVRFYRPQPGSNALSSFAEQRYSGVIQLPQGEAEVLLVVMDKRAHFYVNGEEVLNEYESMMKKGSLYYAMNSGTNKDFGTTCKWSNVDLWIYE